MKTSLVVSFLVIIATPLCAQFNFIFPTAWTNDFRVEAETRGGMMDHEMRIRFTYDSCIYYDRLQSKIKQHSFLLTASQRKEILQKVKQLRQDTTTVPTVADDKGTDTIILFTKDGVFGVDDESDDTEIHNTYLEVKRYLIEFAVSKGKIKKK